MQSSVISFPTNGNLTECMSVLIISDDNFEGPESFSVGIAAPVDGLMVGTPDETLFVISDPEGMQSIEYCSYGHTQYVVCMLLWPSVCSYTAWLPHVSLHGCVQYKLEVCISLVFLSYSSLLSLLL